MAGSFLLNSFAFDVHTIVERYSMFIGENPIINPMFSEAKILPDFQARPRAFLYQDRFL